MVLYIFVRWTRYISIYYERIFLLKRPFIWLARFRHRCGYGVHSPFAFDLITNVIYERTPYYAYSSLEAEQKKCRQTPVGNGSMNRRRWTGCCFGWSTIFSPIRLWMPEHYRHRLCICRPDMLKPIMWVLPICRSSFWRKIRLSIFVFAPLSEWGVCGAGVWPLCIENHRTRTLCYWGHPLYEEDESTLEKDTAGRPDRHYIRFVWFGNRLFRPYQDKTALSRQLLNPLMC